MKRFALIALLLAACAAPPSGPESFAGMTDATLCNNWVTAARSGMTAFAEPAWEELSRRRALTARDVEDVTAGVVRVGMSEAAAICAWGPMDRANRAGGAYGEMSQLVMASGSYVYTRDGRVTSWQQ